MFRSKSFLVEILGNETFSGLLLLLQSNVKPCPKCGVSGNANGVEASTFLEEASEQSSITRLSTD